MLTTAPGGGAVLSCLHVNYHSDLEAVQGRCSGWWLHVHLSLFMPCSSYLIHAPATSPEMHLIKLMYWMCCKQHVLQTHTQTQTQLCCLSSHYRPPVGGMRKKIKHSFTKGIYSPGPHTHTLHIPTCARCALLISVCKLKRNVDMRIMFPDERWTTAKTLHNRAHAWADDLLMVSEDLGRSGGFTSGKTHFIRYTL